MTDEKLDNGQNNQEYNEPSEDAVPMEEYDALQAQLQKKDAELAEFLDTLQRVQAEMENYRKRMMREQARIVECAAQNVILELLPVIDNLERAIHTAIASGEESNLLGGVELTLAQLKGVLKQQGVEEIDPKGQEFDPTKHEAVMQAESPSHSENMVVDVIQKGYELKGSLLRPAMVVVAK